MFLHSEPATVLAGSLVHGTHLVRDTRDKIISVSNRVNILDGADGSGRWRRVGVMTARSEV